MSEYEEYEENPREKTLRIKVEKDKDENVESLKKELEAEKEEKEDLKAQLSLVASKEFDRACDEAIEKAKELDIPAPDAIYEPSELKVLRAQIREKEKKATRPTTPLTYGEGVNRSGSIRNWDFESLEDMVETLNELSSQDEDERLKKEADQILSELGSKALRELESKVGTTYEFRGKIVEPDYSNMTNEEIKEAKEKFKRQKKRWKKVR